MTMPSPRLVLYHLWCDRELKLDPEASHVSTQVLRDC